MPDRSSQPATVKPRAPVRREPPPTSRQIYGLAHALAEEAGVPWPATRAEASALISHLRGEDGAVGR
jgi:hypothetical protein